MRGTKRAILPFVPWALAACLLCPLYAGAAQFAPSALFLSKEGASEGETVLIHAVVQNDSAARFPGTVVFRDGDAQIGSVPATLEPHEVRAVSLSWTPGPGSHAVTAALEDAEGKAVQSETERFSVAATPKAKGEDARSASSSIAAAIESSADIQEKIEGVSPAASGALEPVFRLVDGSRTAIADVLDAQIAATKPKLAPTPGVVAGTSTALRAPEQGHWFSSAFTTAYYYILTALRAVIGSAGAFYPILALAFLFILWRAFKRFRR